MNPTLTQVATDYLPATKVAAYDAKSTEAVLNLLVGVE